MFEMKGGMVFLLVAIKIFAVAFFLLVLIHEAYLREESYFFAFALIAHFAEFLYNNCGYEVNRY